MAETKSVLTSERFAAGLSYEDYIAQIAVNKERFEEYYKTCQLTAEDMEFFKKAAKMPGGSTKVIVLGEAWCPDVMRGMPAAARVAEAAGMEMRVFPRDSHMDIMNEFLKEGKYASIPVVAFFTSDLQELCRWIERPGLADIERTQIEAEVKAAKPGASEQETRAAVGERTRALQPSWQQESIREWRVMLAKKLGV